MKKILISLVALFMGISLAGAQSITPRFGVVGGMTLTKFKASSGEDYGSSKFNAGFNVGGKMEIGLPVVGLFADGSLLFSQKAAANADLYYLDLPINIGYKFHVAPTVALNLKTGPMLGFGLFGSESELFDDNGFNRFNCSWGFGAGIEVLKHFQFGLSYNLGLSNIAGSDYSDVLTVKQNYFRFNVAYMF